MIYFILDTLATVGMFLTYVFSPEKFGGVVIGLLTFIAINTSYIAMVKNKNKDEDKK